MTHSVCQKWHTYSLRIALACHTLCQKQKNTKHKKKTDLKDCNNWIGLDVISGLKLINKFILKIVL